MNIKNFVFIIIACLLATFLRSYIDNNLLISIIGSFVFGFVIERRISKNMKTILLSGFCSCFTSFSGFIFFFYTLINEGAFIKVFIYLNIFLILNLFMMFFGFMISRKII